MRTIKIFVITLTIIILGVSQYSPVTALTVIPRTNLGIDDTASLQQDAFAMPDSIYITPIFLQAEEFVTDFDWYRGLYYYQANRLNQGDFSFHYIIGGDGSIFQANSKGEDQRFRFLDLQAKPIVIAYFAQKNDVDFTAAAKARIADLLIDIANRNSITFDKIFVRNIEYVAKPNEVINARLTPIVGRFERSLQEIKDSLAGRYNPASREYSLTVTKVELPTAPVNYGDNVVANITVKNNSNYPLYQGSDAEILAAKSEGSFSRFFLNGVWSSQTQAPLMPEGTYIKPGESKTLQLRLAVPLYFGDQEENFRLINALGKAYPETQFTVKITVNRMDKQVVEITQTETGQLNVRESPWGSSPIVGRVTPGQRFIVLERTQTGYVKIDLGGGKFGWIVTKYTKVV